MGLAAALLAFQQNQSPQPVPRFRTGVEGVVVDVSVLDRDRRPVRGLTAADFSVLEDGVPQAITAFTAIDIPDVAEPSSTWVRDVAPDVRRNDDIADRRVVVLVLDDATPMPAGEVHRARDLARAAIDRLSADDLVAVVHVLNKRAGQGFTTDRARLLISVEKFNGSIDNIAEMGGKIDSAAVPVPFSSFSTTSATLYRMAAETLRSVAEYLADLPQRRKALLYISVGLPIDIEMAQAAVPGGSGMDTTGVVTDVLSKVRDAIGAAQRSNVTVYGLDPGGLRPGMSARQAGSLNQDFIEGLSTSTGGFAVTDTNDPGPGIAQIIRENSSYYLLGYQPTNRRAVGAFRKIQVRVNRPGVTVRSRSGYYETRPEKGRVATAAEQSDASLLRAVGAFAPQGDVAMQVTAAPFAIPGRDESALAIVVRLAQPAPAGVDRAVETVQLRVNAYDPGGTRRGSERLDARVVLKPTPSGQATYELLSRLDLKPGRYELRLAAQSALQQKTGSVFYDIDVPDFSKGSLMLSGLVMSVVPGVAVAPRERLAPLLPVVPTSQREFGTEDQVSAFVRVYQPGRKPLSPVEMSVTLLDAAGAKVIDRRETLAPDQFARNRTAGCRIGLPIPSLARGPHLLTVEASQGKASARKQVRFSVR
jgi:VWFA-related protein